MDAGWVSVYNQSKEERIMDRLEAIQNRHSVRQYTSRPIEGKVLERIKEEVDACNREGKLHIQLVTDEPKAFDSFMAHYGKFTGVCNYLALIGKQSPYLDERLGYYGQRLVITAQQLGLNTCWVAMSFGKRGVRRLTQKGEKLRCVIALGYGKTQGIAHKSRPMGELYEADGPLPAWFLKGMESAMLAPTAVNQQKFRFYLSGDQVKLQPTGGFYSKVDLGIVKYQFEVGAGLENFHWA